MAWYYNGAGQRYELPERPLEPPDYWRPKSQVPGILDKKAASSGAGATAHMARSSVRRGSTASRRGRWSRTAGGRCMPTGREK